MTSTLVLVHGLASNATRWWRLAADGALPGWNLVFPDMRGHAGSNVRERIGMRQWCDDLARLLDRAQCERAVIGGHCLGANIALHFAARHPQRTAGLILIEPMPARAMRGTLQAVRALRPLLIGAARCGLALNALGLHRRHIAGIDLEQWDRAVEAGTLDLAQYASPLSDLRYLPTAAWLQALAALGAPPPDLSSIGVPALVLLSRGSDMTDPEKATAILRALPRAEFSMLDARHWIPTEQPEAMRRAIEGWLLRQAW